MEACVELLKARFGTPGGSYRLTFVEWVTTYVRRPKYKKAIEYLERWGETFWEETDYRIREVTTKLESELKSAIESKLPGAEFGVEGARSVTEEQKHDVVQRAQHVVNQLQIKELSDIIDLLDEAIDDPQQRYYLVIDRLDENWVDERLRYILIRALIETVRDFFKVRNAKIVLGVRLDLLDRVFRLTRDAGFQEEKYRSLYIRLTWDTRRLVEMLDARINYLVASRYAERQRVGHKDVLPRKVEGGTATDYMTRRTLMRPRDLIAFFNRAIVRAVDNPRISTQMLLAAEGEYSRERLRSLADEWQADYPNLLRAAELLKSGPRQFRLGDLADGICEAFCLTFVDSDFQPSDDLARVAHQVVMSTVDATHFRRQMALIFYRVGLIGLKITAQEGVSWVGVGDRSVSFGEISDSTRVHVHPCFWRALGVRPS